MSEQETKQISWDEALSNNGGMFVKFEVNKRKKIAIQNWQIVEVEKEDFDDKSKMVRQAEFQADVVLENGEQVEKRIGMLSKRFMAAARPYLEGKDVTKPVYLEVTRVGEGNGTNYLVEQYTPTI